MISSQNHSEISEEVPIQPNQSKTAGNEQTLIDLEAGIDLQKQRKFDELITKMKEAEELIIEIRGSLCTILTVLVVLSTLGICLWRHIMIHRGQPLKAKSYFSLYSMVVAFIYVLAKLFTIKAYQHTSLTSVMLLDCWTLPCAMVLSWLFCKTKFGSQELVGFAICVAGLVAVVLSDVHSADGSSGINPLRGDLLIIVGATLYGIYEGIFTESFGFVEMTTFLGIYGAICNASQIVINERNELKSILSSPGTMFPLIGFSLAAFLFTQDSLSYSRSVDRECYICRCSPPICRLDLLCVFCCCYTWLHTHSLFREK